MFWMQKEAKREKAKQIKKMFQDVGKKEKKTSKITNKQQLRRVGALKEKYFAKSVEKLLTHEK